MNDRPPGIDSRLSVATEQRKRLPSVVGIPFFFGLVKPDSQTPSGPYSLAVGSAAPTEPQKPIEMGSKDDFQLAQALNYLKGEPVVKTPPAPVAENKPAAPASNAAPGEQKPPDFGGKDDFQLLQALAFLKGEPVKGQSPTVAQTKPSN